MKSVHIIGLGWLGLPLALRLSALGYSVSGTSSKPEARQALIEAGGQAFPEHTHVGTLCPQVVICTLPPPKESNLQELHALVARQIAEWNSISYYTSSISVYPDDHRVMLETDALESHPIRQLEILYQGSNAPTVILRLGGLHGFGRHPAKYLSGRTGVEKPLAAINLVEGHQVITVIEKLLAKDIKDGVFNVVDERHPTRQEYYCSKCKEMGIPVPVFNPSDERLGKVVSSEKLQRLIGSF